MAGSVNLIRDLSKYSTARLHIATRATGHRDRSYLMEDQIKFFDSENRRMLGLIDERMGCMDIYGQRFLHVMHWRALQTAEQCSTYSIKDRV